MDSLSYKKMVLREVAPTDQSIARSHAFFLCRIQFRGPDQRVQHVDPGRRGG